MIIIRRCENNKGTFDSQIRKLKKGASSNRYQLGCFFRSRVFAPWYIIATCSVTFKKNVDKEGTSFPLPIPIHEQWWLTLRFNWITRHEGLSESVRLYQRNCRLYR